jgi:uncharacterized membrane protein YfcA
MMGAPDISASLAAMIFLAGGIAGALGALLGIGGGVFLVPFLTLALGLPIAYAIPISLTTVIATSSAVSSRTAGRQLINLRLGMILEIATVAGGLVGGVVSMLLSDAALFVAFGLVTAGSAVSMLSRLDKRNVILDPTVDPGRFGGRYHEHESGGEIVYRVKRMPLAMLASFVAGNVSTTLGIGGGIIKVPVLNAWCGVPLRAAAATSAFMIGVTASVGAILKYGAGLLVPGLAAAAVLGVRIGSEAGMRTGARASARGLKTLMAIILFVVSGLMFYEGATKF